MGLFDRFRKPKGKTKGEIAVARLPGISYAIAYFVLPSGVFNECEKFAAIWSDPVTPAGPVFYYLGCQFRGVEPVREYEVLYQARCGQLDDALDYYLLEYPVPPVVDFTKIFPGKNIAEAEVPVLAPLFSAMLRHRETGSVVAYYVLGQSPVGGGTTLRSIGKDGVNANLGAGSAPELDAFLECLRTAPQPAG